jgi:hypothetical protein
MASTRAVRAATGATRTAASSRSVRSAGSPECGGERSIVRRDDWACPVSPNLASPQGRTSGSCALVRARGPQPGRIGLALPNAAASGQLGERYVAWAWVRSTAPGQQVVLRLVGNGGKQSAEASATTLPGLARRRVIVAHTATAQNDLSLEVTSDAVRAGDSLLVDEVVIRRGWVAASSVDPVSDGPLGATHRWRPWRQRSGLG